MESEETGGTSQRGGGECLGRCRPSGPRADAHDAVPVGEAVLRVLDRIEAHLALHPDVTCSHRAMANEMDAFCFQDIDAQNDTLIADENTLVCSGDQFANLATFLAAKVAIDLRVIHHTRPLALSASQALIRQATWNAIIAMPSAVVYGRMSCMGVSFPQAALDEWFDSFHLSHAAGVTAPFVAFSICTCELRDGSLLPRTQ